MIDGGRSSVGRAPGCDPGRRGFESHRPPQPFLYGPLAQLVEQLTLNQLVVGSIPTRPTIPAHGAKVAELVNALDLGSSGETLESSSLSFRTIFSSTEF
jgi:hypothetical protein